MQMLTAHDHFDRLARSLCHLRRGGELTLEQADGDWPAVTLSIQINETNHFAWLRAVHHWPVASGKHEPLKEWEACAWSADDFLCEMAKLSPETLEALPARHEVLSDPAGAFILDLQVRHRGWFGDHEFRLIERQIRAGDMPGLRIASSTLKLTESAFTTLLVKDLDPACFPQLAA